jgi:threonine synthase
VLDEFFRTGVYRPRNTAETHATSSPSMDISKASNFERFVFDLVGRDGNKVRELWSKVDAGGAFDLSGSPEFAAIGQYGFASGSSNHADRLATIRLADEKYATVIDTHTADGLKVALELRDPAVPTLVLETAQPAKFEETIVEALGRKPGAPGRPRQHRGAAPARRGDGRGCRGHQGPDRPDGRSGLTRASHEKWPRMSGAVFCGVGCVTKRPPYQV